MVTISELTWDDEQLLELFALLSQRDQGLLMRQAAVAASFALVQMEGSCGPDGTLLTDTPEAVTVKALWRCAPELPCGWPSDTDFGWQVENEVKSRLGDRALDVILTTSEHDARNAQLLVDWAEEFADRFGPDFCTPKFEDGYVEPASMQRFIEDWRDSFMDNLRRSYTRLSTNPKAQPTP